MSFICQTEHTGIVGHFYNGSQIAANTVVGRVVYQYCYRIGMLGNGLCHLLPLHSQGNTQVVIDFRVDVHGNGTAQDQCVDDAAVDIPGQNDFIAVLTGGQHHALDGTGGSANH